MKIIVRTKGFNIWIPCPVGLAGFVVKRLPDSLFREMRKDVPQPYKGLITKKNVCVLVTECLDILKENKGLEAVHVEASDGTFVSITL